MTKDELKEMLSDNLEIEVDFVSEDAWKISTLEVKLVFDGTVVASTEIDLIGLNT